MKIGHIPVLTCGRQGKTVLVYHGYGADKETQRKELESLAAAGFFAVGVDAVGHGERAWPDRAQRMQRRPRATLLQMIEETVAEIPYLVQALRDDYGADTVGITGISMGGYVTFAAPLAEPSLVVAVPILGSPDWTALVSDWAESPHWLPQRFPPRALLALNAGQDEHVPPQSTREFMAALQPYYAPCPERLEYREYARSGHFMREDDWADLWGRTVGWFQRWL